MYNNLAIEKNIENFRKIKSRAEIFAENIRTIVNRDSVELLIEVCLSGFPDKDKDNYMFYTDDVIQDVSNTIDELEILFPAFCDELEKLNNQDLYLFGLAYRVEGFYAVSESNSNPFDAYMALHLLKYTLSTETSHPITALYDDVYSDAIGSCFERRHVLYEKRRQLLKKDNYGFIDPSAWALEKNNFTQSLLNQTGVSLRDESGIVLFKVISRHIIDNILDAITDDTLVDSHASTNNLSNSAKGIGYEIECISILRENGWIAMETPQTGDKGADIVATKRGFKAVFQCKIWIGKVDTSAIQEVATAKLFYEADIAVLICENGCTKQAEEISTKLGIIVVSKNDISEIEILIIKKLMT